MTTDTVVPQTDTDTDTDLTDLARRARWQVIKTVTTNKAGHIGGPLSMMDLLVGLYFRELRIRPEEPDWPDRDRFILSKGHAAIGLYSVLALRGYPRNAVPSTIVLDRSHRVAAVFLTAILASDLQPVVDRLATEPPPPAG